MTKETIINGEDLIAALRERDISRAQEIITTSYKSFLHEIEGEALKAKKNNRQPNVDLNQFSNELLDIEKHLSNDEKPYFTAALKGVVNITNAHRECAVTAFRTLLKETQKMKDKDVSKDTLIGSIPGMLDTVKKLNEKGNYTEQTTLGEVYSDRQKLLEEQSGTLGKAIKSVVKKFSNKTEPTPQDYKDFVRQIVNLGVLETLSESIAKPIKKQAEKALADGLPENYSDFVQREVTESNQVLPLRAAKAVYRGLKSAVGAPEKDLKKELVKNLNTNIASMAINQDLEQHPFTEAQLDSVDALNKKVRNMKNNRGIPQTIGDLINYLFEEIKNLFTRLFGSESSKIVNEFKAELRSEMRDQLKHNISGNVDEGIRKIESASNRLGNAVAVATVGM